VLKVAQIKKYAIAFSTEL